MVSDPNACTLILLKTWRYISHLLTYLLTYSKKWLKLEPSNLVHG